jgi:putative membrane protein
VAFLKIGRPQGAASNAVQGFPSCSAERNRAPDATRILVTMKNTPILTAITILLGLACSTFAADAKLPSGDEAFLKKAAEGGLMEVKLGEIAATRAKRQDVKDFGGQMVKDHSQANAELKALAAAKGVTVPDSLGTLHQKKLEKMSKLEGDAFDGAYVKDMVEDHETDVKDFEKEGSTGTDPDVKAFVAKTLPVLKAHLEHIKTISGKK